MASTTQRPQRSYRDNALHLACDGLAHYRSFVYWGDVRRGWSQLEGLEESVLMHAACKPRARQSAKMLGAAIHPSHNRGGDSAAAPPELHGLLGRCSAALGAVALASHQRGRCTALPLPAASGVSRSRASRDFVVARPRSRTSAVIAAFRPQAPGRHGAAWRHYWLPLCFQDHPVPLVTSPARPVVNCGSQRPGQRGLISYRQRAALRRRRSSP
jgi:hypothetical protein